MPTNNPNTASPYLPPYHPATAASPHYHNLQHYATAALTAASYHNNPNTTADHDGASSDEASDRFTPLVGGYRTTSQSTANRCATASGAAYYCPNNPVALSGGVGMGMSVDRGVTRSPVNFREGRRSSDGLMVAQHGIVAFQQKLYHKEKVKT